MVRFMAFIDRSIREATILTVGRMAGRLEKRFTTIIVDKWSTKQITVMMTANEIQKSITI